MAIVAAGFLGVIILGAVLLYLPVCNQTPIEFIDALFTSVTSVCVTGLVTITPATQFTVAGKVVLLILIQIGGLGIIACIAAFSFILRQQFSLSEKIAIQEAYNLSSPGGIVRMIRRVLLGTLAVEGAGAVFYSFRFVPEFGWARGIGYGIFHAVSAFCNAGIDILGDSSLAAYAADPLINLTTMLLIVIGGLGFSVWFDLIDNFRRVQKHEVPKAWIFTRLTLHSKLVLVMTGILLFTGTFLVFLMEFSNPDTLGSLSLGQKVMASFFQSVTTRTAGFFTISQADMHEETKLLSCIWMFIGGSPGGTAGGVKTTTIAMLVLSCVTVIRGGRDTECFGRKISIANFRTGFSVVAVSFSVFLIGVLLIAVLEPDSISIINILFEASSAVGTVGLTADLTPQLTRASQCVIMVLMYMGRLGPVSLALLFAGKKNPRDDIRELPQENIIVG